MLDFVIHRQAGTREALRQRVMRGELPGWLARSKRMNYIRQVLLSTPPWVDRHKLRLIKERARAISALSGVDHHIAHIVPLNHPRVCGLTVPWNLEIKTARSNLAESNHMQLDEQLPLF